MDNKKMSSDKFMIDAAIAFYVDSLPSAPLPMTPLGSSQKSRPAAVSTGGVAAATASASIPSSHPGSRVLTPMSSRVVDTSDNQDGSMFFPADNFGEGVLSPVGAGATPRGSGRGFHGFGLQLPPTPQGHPAFTNSASTTPITSSHKHFKFNSEPTPTNAGRSSTAASASTSSTSKVPAATTTSVSAAASLSRTPMKSSKGGVVVVGEISTEACVPHKPTSQATAKCYQGEDMDEMMNEEVPEFRAIVNYPAYVVQPGRKRKRIKKKEDGANGVATATEESSNKRCCVMCGTACPKSASGYADENRAVCGGTHAIIPAQNKGLCTTCDVTVWVHQKSHMQIKWCKGCKNFRTWAAFGHKGHLTKCMKCRDEQNKRYARQKELAAERKRARALALE